MRIHIDQTVRLRANEAIAARRNDIARHDARAAPKLIESFSQRWPKTCTATGEISRAIAATAKFCLRSAALRFPAEPKHLTSTGMATEDRHAPQRCVSHPGL